MNGDDESILKPTAGEEAEHLEYRNTCVQAAVLSSNTELIKLVNEEISTKVFQGMC